MRSLARAEVARLAAGVFLLASLPYVNGLKNGFTFDDVPIVAENPRIRSLAGIGRAFASDWWDGTRPQSLLYRPLTMASFAIDYAAARSVATDPPPLRLPSRSALPFHLQNLVWHAAASVALFLLVLELFQRPWLAFATAALFAVHPVHTEAVNGIVGRAELMSACLGLLALLGAWRGRPVLASILLFLALLSKEHAIVIPLIALLRVPSRAGPGLRRALSGFAVAVLAFLALRTAVLGSPVGIAPSFPPSIEVDNPIAGAAGAARVWTPVRVGGHALGLLAFPRSLSADYSYDQIPLVASPDLGTALSMLALTALLLGGVLLYRRSPPASFGIFFFLLSWLVTSNIPIVIGTIFGERLLYLPSAGACLAIAAALTSVRARGLGTTAVAAAVLAGSARTLARNHDWKDNATLFASTVVTSSRSCKALDGHASELLAAGHPRDAIAWAERALAVYPDYPNAQLTLAKSLRLLANEEPDPGLRRELRRRAADAARRVADAEASADAWSVLGGLALDGGNAGEALAHFRKSLEREPRFVPALIGLGVAELQDGRAAAAVELFERALALDPGNAEASRNLEAGSLANMHGLRGQRLLEERRWPEALSEFREAARLEPARARAHLGIGAALAEEADAEPDPRLRSALIDEAIASFERALAVEPEEATAHMNLGIIYLRQRRDPARAIEHFRAYLRLVPDTPQRARMEETIRRLQQPAAPQVP